MTTPAKARISGYCNPTLPRTVAYDPHQRCKGCDCRATNCPCNPEEPDPMNETEMNHIQADVTPLDAVRLLNGGWVAPDVVQAPPEPGTPEDAVSWLRSAADALNTAAKGYGPDDWRDAVRLLRDLRRAVNVAQQVDAAIVTWLYLHGEHGQHQLIDGIAGEVYIGRGRSKERWESEEGVRDYVDAKIEDLGGEYPDPQQVVQWVLEVLPATASTSLRKTPLRAAGLDVKDYLNDEPGTVKVDVLT